MDQIRLIRDFGYHQPTSDLIKDTHQEIRNRCYELAEHINRTLPDCREKSLAITQLELAMFWANAGVARVLNYE